jgi:hypothetical protein
MESPSNGAEPTVVPSVSVTFSPDGQMRLETAGGVGPPQLWAAARLIELWGDSEFTAQQIGASQIRDRIVRPDGGRSGLRRIGS